MATESHVLLLRNNGQGGIRTLEGVAPLPVFEATATKAESFVESGTGREYHPGLSLAKAIRTKVFALL